MCTRKMKWDLTPLARVMYELVKDAAGRTETSMRKWIETPNVPHERNGDKRLGKGGRTVSNVLSYLAAY